MKVLLVGDKAKILEGVKKLGYEVIELDADGKKVSEKERVLNSFIVLKALQFMRRFFFVYKNPSQLLYALIKDISPSLPGKALPCSIPNNPLKPLL